MAVVIDEVVTEPAPANAANGANSGQSAEPAQPPPAHEIMHLLEQQRARLARVRAH